MKKKVAEEEAKKAAAARRKRRSFLQEELQKFSVVESVYPKGPRGRGEHDGHGKGKYVSKCNKKTWWCDKKHGAPFNPSCTCECNEGWVGNRCQNTVQTRQLP